MFDRLASFNIVSDVSLMGNRIACLFGRSTNTYIDETMPFPKLPQSYYVTGTLYVYTAD